MSERSITVVPSDRFEREKLRAERERLRAKGWKRLALDMGEALREYSTHGIPPASGPTSRACWEQAIVPALLARLDALGKGERT